MRGTVLVIILGLLLCYSQRLASCAVLDISQVDELFYDQFEYYYDYVHTKMFNPIVGVSITSVKEGPVTLWDVGPGEICPIVTIRLKDNEPILVNITIYGRERYMIYLLKQEGRWSSDPVNTKEKLYMEFDKLKTIPAQIIPFTLNLTAMSGIEFDIFELAIFSLSSWLYVPKVAFSITEIGDGGDVIWKANEDERRCTSVFAHLKDGSPYLLYFLVKGADDSRKRQYYYKDGSKWIRTTFSEINDKLEDLLDALVSDIDTPPLSEDEVSDMDGG
ncbi:signal peptide-containing protein [Theileria equi strain WA]|uniref:Signal peptide-containing protein n=1 Tax=Theileria equi strain WA TaxID=1537102 RepID=L0B1G0_THEEQ|nr:signal peptide-containing protein [Theileria equi strain WA]AFZ80944.1 signal peptide-containing protein [Theileria equi strain WA]|eukprot:XP_004830610.1 signal peptide-containing protein [Theileria equi strain WA]